MPSPHPVAPFLDQLVQPPSSALDLGYRMPAEWEAQQAVWVDPPHHPETWPGCLSQAQAQFQRFIDELAMVVPVRHLAELGVETVDSWIRDTGPIFVVRSLEYAEASSSPGPSLPRLALHDFHFNSWGGKYEARQPDDLSPQYVARHLNIPLWIHPMVLEGGSVDVNGQGALLTTGQCLLNKNRNPLMKKRDIEKSLHQALGAEHIIWLPGGIIGDDTDGHVDDIARFIKADTVAGLRAPANHPDKPMLDRNWKVLQKARDQNGQKLNLVMLPVPEPIFYDFPADRFLFAGRRPVAASYANFFMCNQKVFVPVFGQATDDQACRVLEDALSGWRIVPIRAEFLVVGMGSLHCLTQQQPA